MKHIVLRPSSIVLVLVLVGCDAYDNDAYRELVVVEAIMEAGAPVSPLFLSTTVPLDEVFSSANARTVNDASVVLERLDAAGVVLETIPYANVAPVGRYDPVPDFDRPTAVPRLAPRARYRLVVDVPDYGRVTAETVVPDTFSVVVPPASPATYQDPAEQPTVTVTPSENPARQAIYLFSILAADQEGSPDPSFLTPFARAIYDNFESESERREFLIESVYGASPLLNETNYTRNADGTLTIPVPWLGFSYYGFNELFANAVDDALNLFISTQAAQFQPTTLSPGEIPNISSNVENGLGLFGTYARARTTVTITPQ